MCWKHMPLKTVLTVNVVLFSLIGIVHLLRIIGQWEVRFGGWFVGYWLNVVAIVIAAAMVYINSRHLRKVK